MRNICLLFLLFSFNLQAANVISDIRIWPAPDNTKMVLELSESVNYQLQYSTVKSQIIITLPDTRANFLLDRKFDDKRIVKIRTKRENGKLLLAIDLKAEVRAKSFLALPNAKYGYRLVVDLQDVDMNLPVKSIPKDNKLLVAIDAGHGGEDAGSIGANQLKEKDVVLAIARDLQEYIKHSPNMRAVMIRDGDYYLSLKNRVKESEKIRADIFISIHADAFKDDSAKGASVYILAKKDASSTSAKWLADKENSADIIGGVAIDEGADSVLQYILSDLVSGAKYRDSKKMAKEVLRSLKKDHLVDIHLRHVEQANFFVLRQNSIPAVLIETGFISNHDEAQLLQDTDYRKQIARLIFDALEKFRKSK